MSTRDNQLASINEKANRLIATNLRKQVDVDNALPLAIELSREISDFLNARPEKKVAAVTQIELKKKPRIAFFSASLVELSIDSNRPEIIELACVLCAAGMDEPCFYHESHYTLSTIHVACDYFGLSMRTIFDKYGPFISTNFHNLICNIAERRTRGLLGSMRLRQIKINGKTRFKAIE
ncbi:MAG: hypothetical protein MEQ07_12060 [Aquimonas sp.]|nr:hypothetical protein [Aquimonas sp.]